MSLLQIHQHKQLLLSRCSSSTGTSRFGMLYQARCSHAPPANTLNPRKVCCGAGKRPGGPAGRSNAAAQQQRSGKQSQHDEGVNVYQLAPTQQGSVLKKTITISIKEISNDDLTGLQELEDIVDQWGSSFDYIHAAAAFVKAGSMIHMQPAAATRLLDVLAGIWDRLLPEAGAQGLTTVLWACGKLRYRSPGLWSSTVDAFMEQLQHDKQQFNSQNIAHVLHGLATVALANKGEVPGVPKADVEAVVKQACVHMQILVTCPNMDGVMPQHLSNTLWACAKLRINPGNAVANSLLQAMSRPDMLDVVKPQELSNVLWAVGNLRQCGIWQPQLKQQVWQRLLSEQQLARIADKGNPQNVANSLLAFAWLGSPAAAETQGPAGTVLSPELAHQSASALLQGKVAQQVQIWSMQNISNSLWASAKLGAADYGFFDSAASAAAGLLPTAVAADVVQVAYACRVLQFERPQLMAALVKRSKQLLQQRGRAATDAVGLAVAVAYAVAVLDMQQLAGDARDMVASSLEGPASTLAKGYAGMLWGVHAWLVQHQLLDGQGLAGLLTEQQLAQGRAGAEAYQVQRQQQQNQQQQAAQ